MTTTDSSDSHESLINWDKALKAVSGSEEILDSIVEAALEEIPQLRDQLSAAIESADIPVAHRAAHTIAGVLRIFDATALIEVARQIEQLTAAGSLEGVPELRQQLILLVQHTIKELQDHRT